MLEHIGARSVFTWLKQSICAQAIPDLDRPLLPELGLRADDTSAFLHHPDTTICATVLVHAGGRTLAQVSTAMLLAQ